MGLEFDIGKCWRRKREVFLAKLRLCFSCSNLLDIASETGRPDIEHRLRTKPPGGSSA